MIRWDAERNSNAEGSWIQKNCKEQRICNAERNWMNKECWMNKEQLV